MKSAKGRKSVKLHKTKDKVKKLRSHRHFSKGAIFVVAFGLIGAFAVIRSFAATPTAHFESETAAPNNSCASPIADSSASGNTALSLSCTEEPPTPAPTGDRGARLPISYNLSSLTGTVRYVATNGSDSAAGTASAPYATLAKAVSASSSGNTIVVRGGTYRDQAAVSVGSKTLKIIAYPGEVPVFNGARQVTSGWTSESTYRYIPYTPMVLSNGTMSITTGQGVTGGSSGPGVYPDQAWIGNTQLQQVTSKTSLTDGKFFVDRTNNRLYLTSTDAGKTSIEVSQRGKFITVDSPNSTIEGLKITRYSDSGGDYGVVLARWDADNFTMKNVELSEIALIPIFITGQHPGGNWNNNTKLLNITMNNINWMGVHSSNVNDFVMDSSVATNFDQWNEFGSSPVSGAIKFGRAWGTKLTNNYLDNLKSHGFWWDDSNYNTVVANNNMTNITGSAIFYEISDEILIVNNLITITGGSGQALKLAAASGVKLVNNTIVGGKDQVGLYTDYRSAPPAGEKPCYDYTRGTPCGPEGDQWANNWDKERTRPVTLDWRPRLDLSINNIFAYPAGSGSFCGGTPLVCVTTKHSLGAIVPLEDIIHKANYPYPGLPQTFMDSNVYANGALSINRNGSVTNYTSGSTFASAMAAAPVSIAGLEANSRFGTSWVLNDGNGTPSGTLGAVHNQATAVPSNPIINQYIPAGTRHYGVTYK